MAGAGLLQELIRGAGFFKGATGPTGVGGEQTAQQAIEGHDGHSIGGNNGPILGGCGLSGW